MGRAGTDKLVGMGLLILRKGNQRTFWDSRRGGENDSGFEPASLTSQITLVRRVAVAAFRKEKKASSREGK